MHKTHWKTRCINKDQDDLIKINTNLIKGKDDLINVYKKSENRLKKENSMLKNKMKDTSNSLMIMKSAMNGEYDSYLYERANSRENSDIFDKDEIKNLLKMQKIVL